MADNGGQKTKIKKQDPDYYEKVPPIGSVRLLYCYGGYSIWSLASSAGRSRQSVAGRLAKGQDMVCNSSFCFFGRVFGCKTYIKPEVMHANGIEKRA
jgi:hypothetical protein